MSETPRRCYSWRGPELRLHTRVVTRSSSAGVAAVRDARLRVKLHAPPLDGRANRELTDLIAAWLGVPRSAVTITAGLRSRDKTLAIQGVRDLPGQLRE